jgi:hypothetical protein
VDTQADTHRTDVPGRRPGAAEVVHAEHGDLSNVRIGQPTQQAQQRVTADPHTQRGCQSRTRATGQGDRDRGQGRPHGRTVSGVRRGQPVDLLGERGPRALGHPTGKPAHLQPDHHRIAARGEIGETSLVAAVHPLRRGTAVRAYGHLPGSPHLENYLVSGSLHVLHHDTRQVRQQNIEVGKIAPRPALPRLTCAYSKRIGDASDPCVCS